MNKITTQRCTKYCQSIEKQLEAIGHATNSVLLSNLRQKYPKLSATTVHRATARLAERNIISIAPSANDGSTQYDTNTSPHDHFQCQDCGKLIDIDIKDKIIPVLKSAIDNCNVSGQLTINGTCDKCSKEKK